MIRHRFRRTAEKSEEKRDNSGGPYKRVTPSGEGYWSTPGETLSIPHGLSLCLAGERVRKLESAWEEANNPPKVCAKNGAPPRTFCAVAAR